MLGRMTLRLVRPAAEYLPHYVAALERAWSPNNLRGRAAADEELAGIAADGPAFLASLVDREAAGGPVKLPDGSFELTWTSGGVSVTMQLRLIASPTTGSGSSAGNDTPSASGGLRGVQLPALVVGAAAAPAGPAPGATAANGGRP